jgi:hypothetical protein
MAYDRQCQDLYRLRMQLQEVRSQGNDAESFAAQTNRQHKQVRRAGKERGGWGGGGVGGEGGQALCSGGFWCLCGSMNPHRIICGTDQQAAQAGEASWQHEGRCGGGGKGRGAGTV